MDDLLAGWDIGRMAAVDWSPWGSGDLARAKVLANGDGFYLALVEAQPGYAGDPHEHVHTEFLYVLDGDLVSNGQSLRTGDGYVASAGSVHHDFRTETGATYLSIFKL